MSAVPALPSRVRACGPAVRVGLVVAVAWCAAASSTIAANSPTALDALPGAVAPPDDTPTRPTARAREPRGNPLWAIPLSALTATRERPLFLPSRRPPVAPAVAGPPVVVIAKPVEDPRPELSLVGAVAGETEGFAIFIDLRSNAMVRLRTGQEHAGWTLSSVKGREAILAKDNETAAFVLPAPGGNGFAPVPAVTGESASADGAAVAVAATGQDAAAAPGGRIVMPKSAGDFAPFTPRSTPKNGESDGL
jgi:general secretion pathway protein N